MGLLPLTLLRDRRNSFVELYSYDDRGSSSYGTAGYLGDGYFITVKHGVVALGQEGPATRARSSQSSSFTRTSPWWRGSSTPATQRRSGSG